MGRPPPTLFCSTSRNHKWHETNFGNSTSRWLEEKEGRKKGENVNEKKNVYKCTSKTGIRYLVVIDKTHLLGKFTRDNTCTRVIAFLMIKSKKKTITNRFSLTTTTATDVDTGKLFIDYYYFFHYQYIKLKSIRIRTKDNQIYIYLDVNKNNYLSSIICTRKLEKKTFYILWSMIILQSRIKLKIYF